jgi:hypothetical protein
VGALLPALVILAASTLLSFVVAYKLVKARQAARWPSAAGVITRSRTRVVKERRVQEVTTAKTVAALEYQYEVDGIRYHGTQIRAGDRFGSVPEAEILDRFPEGATVPVYYNPAAPGESVLEPRLPYSEAKAWAFAAALFLAGVGGALVLTNLDAVMPVVDSVFPEGSQPPGALFFGLCSLWTLFMIWDNRRQVARARRWPTADGIVVSSTAEAYETSAGAPNRGGRVKLYEPVVEYSYEVNGREYHSTKVSFGARVSTQLQKAAEARAARYPRDAKVVVHYDPEHPALAVLETGVASQTGTILLAVVFVGLTLFFSGVRP